MFHLIVYTLKIENMLHPVVYIILLTFRAGYRAPPAGARRSRSRSRRRSRSRSRYTKMGGFTKIKLSKGPLKIDIDISRY